MAKETSAKSNIAIIGHGHIGSALLKGFLKSGVDPRRLIVADPSSSKDKRLKKLRMKTTGNNNDAAINSDFIFLAVKPPIVSTVLSEIQQAIKGKVIVSLAAGINISTLKKHAGSAHVARIMPNMPIAVNEGIVGFLAGNLSKKEKEALARLLSGLGALIETTSDRDLDRITLLSGCGPGIISFLIAALADSARKLGLPKETADKIAKQTFGGTLAYLEHSGISPEALMKSVATKGGVTEAILADLSKSGLSKDLTHAIKVGYARIKKLNR